MVDLHPGALPLVRKIAIILAVVAIRYMAGMCSRPLSFASGCGIREFLEFPYLQWIEASVAVLGGQLADQDMD